MSDQLIENTEETEKFFIFYSYDSKIQEFISMSFKSKNCSEFEIKFLEEACKLCVNTNIHELYEHLIIFIENKFRDFNDFKYDGVIFAENLNYEYKFFKKFFRDLILKLSSKDFKKKINYKYFDAKNEWIFLNDKKKKEKILETCVQFKKKNSNIKFDIEILRIENHNDIYLNLLGNLEPNEKSNICLKLEIFLKSNLEKSLLVYFDWKTDISKLRRLTIK
tara:strand:- start:14434 stop:15096 length:663 start_codon:yes stop_codon:yes gene_type:complete